MNNKNENSLGLTPGEQQEYELDMFEKGYNKGISKMKDFLVLLLSKIDDDTLLDELNRRFKSKNKE